MESLDRILDTFVNPNVNNGHTLLAAAFAVVDKSGQILYKNAVGRLEYAPSAASYSLDSVSWIASLSKLPTAICALQLVEKGLIGLDDDVRHIVPRLATISILEGFDDDGTPILKTNTKPITLRQLLSHTTGLGYDRANPDLMRWSKAVGRTSHCMSFNLDGVTTPLLFEPGTQWRYSTGLDWAGHIIEILTCQSLGQYMQENIFTPLNMSSTTFRMSHRPDLIPRSLAFTFREPGSPESPLAIKLSPTSENPEMDCGGNGLFSTPQDYITLLSAILTHSLLNEDSTRKLFMPQLSQANQKVMMDFLDTDIRDKYCPEFPRGLSLNYGLGGMLNMQDVPGKRRKGSMMWMGYSNSHWWIDPESGIAATLFAQILPDGDKTVIDLYDSLERAVYRDLITT